MMPEGQTPLIRTFAAGEGLSLTGMSEARIVTSCINGNVATTDAINVITTTGPRCCQRDSPC